MITCRPFDAAEARAAGFLNRVVAEDELDAAVDTLVAQVIDKPAFPVWATKRHVDAVTSQMVGTDRSWGDADGLVSDECSTEAITFSLRRKEAWWEKR